MTGRPVELDWYACDLRSGLIVAELPGTATAQPLSRTLGASTTSSVTVVVDGMPPVWLPATTPGRTMLVPVDRLTGQPITAGIVLTRARGTAATITVGIASPEAYLDRRYSGTYTGIGADQAAIITGTGTALTVDAPPFTWDAPTIGAAQDYTVADSDDRTILSVWQELMAMETGPEFTVDVRWNDTRTGFTLPVRVRGTNGVGLVTDQPMAVFDLPGCITSYTVTESYSSDQGATSVIAYGDGEGAGRLRSDVQTAADLLAAGYCLWEHRYTPASATTDPVALNASAAGTLAVMGPGAATWEVTAVASVAPRVGSDFSLGDSVRLQIDRSPGHPDGATTTARCWGWQLDPSQDTVTPVLIEDEENT